MLEYAHIRTSAKVSAVRILHKMPSMGSAAIEVQLADHSRYRLPREQSRIPSAGDYLIVPPGGAAFTLHPDDFEREFAAVPAAPPPRPDGHEQVKLPPELAAQYPVKITRPMLEAMFERVDYEVRRDGRTTVCEITFKNGFTIDGRSSAACASEFKEHIGQQAAYAKALDKAWELAGFMLREDRYRAGLKS